MIINFINVWTNEHACKMHVHQCTDMLIETHRGGSFVGEDDTAARFGRAELRGYKVYQIQPMIMESNNNRPSSFGWPIQYKCPQSTLHNHNFQYIYY